eukprot:TRINITY_DN3632_c0_g5_i1.p1 TRINITY_DN3632_c0_g5~~TRINITY_DN3632_c0_g5_i1.p1  ORF type:complete len:665 (+),score=115.10 TRINITY_DN3632_c0_g5_i1:96-2090(+)
MAPAVHAVAHVQLPTLLPTGVSGPSSFDTSSLRPTLLLPKCSLHSDVGQSSFHGQQLPSVSTHVGNARYGQRRHGRVGVASAAVAVAPAKMSKVVKWGEGKRLQTQVAPIAPDTTTIRSLDWDRDRFDIEFGLQNGTTYNSFLIQADKVALIDASHEKFRDLYFAALKGEIDPTTIDYVVANHTEPDHSGLIRDLVEINPNITVVGSRVCIQFLQNLVLRPFKSQVVKAGDQIDLGKGHVLEFVIAPNLHWPDTMFTLDKGTGVMYTCDAFGMHYSSETIYDEDLPVIEPHYRFYYDCLMKPNARSVLTALRKIKDWEFGVIATGHGPLLRYNVPELMSKYQSWSTQALEKQSTSVAVFYVSDYGYSDRLSQALARGITKTDTGVEMVDLKVADPQEVVECVGRNAAVVMMTPPTSGPANATFNTLYAAIKPKQPFLLAESYGGDDEPVDTITRRLIDLGVNPAFPALRVKEAPNEATYQQYEEEGTDMGQLLNQKASMAAKRGMNTDIAKALARISGGLYVVTAMHGSSGSSGAMIASWVSQASFKPLGITIAVAKDRAIESLMQVGDTFVLNCLADDNFSPLMKHFLKRFPPGADRFEGVDWAPGRNGSPILNEAIAYMECKVISRMETADHWITYGEVTDGNVSKPDGRTASHHRKIANYY